MQLHFTEYNGCFAINLKAEDMKEAALLTRFGMNRTNEIRYASTSVSQSGEFQTSITFAKHKANRDSVPKRS